MKKVGIIAGLWSALHLILLFFASCDPCDGGPVYQRLQGLTAEPKRIEGIEESPSWGAHYQVVPYHATEQGIRYDSLGIEVLQEIFTALHKGENRFDFGINSAYACDPAVEIDRIQEVIITSSRDYTAAYPAGENLQEIMRVRNFYAVEGNEIEHLIPYGISRQTLFFTFQLPPDEEGLHAISIQYILEDGQVFEASTRELLIKR